MLQRMAGSRAGELHRLALQLAVQLPESGVEAHAVLADVEDLLDRPGLRGPDWQLRGVVGAVERVSVPAKVFWTSALFLTMAPVSAALAHMVGLQLAGALLFMAAISAVALVFGRGFGVGLSAAAAVSHNLLAVPPALHFSVPGALEALFLLAYLMASLLIPWLSSNAAAIRSCAVTACIPRRPSGSLWLRG